MGFLTEWRPFQTQSSLMRPSMFDEMFREFLTPTMAGEAGGVRFMPRVNVTETPEAYTLDVELPGIDPEQVNVTLVGDTLTIQGEKRQEERDEGEHWHVVERSYGSFQRSFTFPTPVNSESVTAESKNGVLCIEVAKAREAQPRRIEIRAGGGDGHREIQTTAREVSSSQAGEKAGQGEQAQGRGGQPHGKGGGQQRGKSG